MVTCARELGLGMKEALGIVEPEKRVVTYARELELGEEEAL